jgi:hypothetical protein
MPMVETESGTAQMTVQPVTIRLPRQWSIQFGMAPRPWEITFGASGAHHKVQPQSLSPQY